MSKRDPLVTLRQMREFAMEAATLAQAHTAKELETDLPFRRHAERVAELIGEAANRLPKELHEAWPGIPWREIIGMRNWLIHGYDGIDPEILWDVLSRRATQLLPLLDEMIEAFEA
jgi:uncharacterized protein with HEPN domain